ncbi:hypothetical protein GCM10023185_38400 [Hymenobacter saemangeumensis]|uniref:Glyoxalase n=1 Tax=Hymenobacter saemangeumensis TaxID=1084522 RepID=A0ABP8IQH9_9BACT
MSISPLPSPTRADEALLALRPVISAAPEQDAPSAGHFLHTTLRPVLKLQNELLLQVVADFVHDHHMPLPRLAVADQERQLAELLARNTKLRYSIIGLVSGMFTSAEYQFYRAHRPEINRRLLELAQRRVLDQVAEVMQLLKAA